MDSVGYICLLIPVYTYITMVVKEEEYGRKESGPGGGEGRNYMIIF